MTILVTGGLGYIGSHVCVELLENGHDIVIMDNLSNSKISALHGIEGITGKKPRAYIADVRDKNKLMVIFGTENIDAVIHLASLKSVNESIYSPIEYYRNNVDGLMTLCEVMNVYEVKKLVFSSSATIYGDNIDSPLRETDGFGRMTNPYGKTKAVAECFLTDLCTSDGEWDVTIFRYFNPIGAHKSGFIGEDPKGTPWNLMACIADVMNGKRRHLDVFGDDYETPDGTAIRDYVHVVDLAAAHALAIEKHGNGAEVYNLGTGKGYSVMKLLQAYERACGRSVPYEVKPRRKGDVAISYCDASKAEKQLGWKAKKTLEEMCADAWRYEQLKGE